MRAAGQPLAFRDAQLVIDPTVFRTEQPGVGVISRNPDIVRTCNSFEKLKTPRVAFEDGHAIQITCEPCQAMSAGLTIALFDRPDHIHVDAEGLFTFGDGRCAGGFGAQHLHVHLHGNWGLVAGAFADRYDGAQLHIGGGGI